MSVRSLASRAPWLAASLFLGGCRLWPYEDGYPYTTVDPISDFGVATQELYATITYIVVVIFVMVSILLAYTLVAFRDDGSPGNPEQIHGNIQMEIGWTLLPIAIVIMLIIPTVRTVFEIADAAPAGAVDAEDNVILNDDGSIAKPTVEIKAIGRRWWWAFEYIESGVVTGNQFSIPDDRPVSVLITSDTVIHSFWVPRIGGKRDAVPGRVNKIWFNLNLDVPKGEPEHIRGECAEFCGEAHALMRFEVLALDGSDYDQWLSEMQEPRPMDAAIKEKGEAAFVAGGCVGCHSIRGNELAMGVQGPNLTAFGDRRWLAAGVHDMFPNGRADDSRARELLTTWIRNPNELKPGTTKSANPSRALDGMNIPVDADANGILTREEMSDETVNAIIDYLLAMKTSYILD